MPEGEVHPGSFVGDSVEEFKKMPTWGKAIAVGAVVVVAYLGYRAYTNNAQSASGATAGMASGSSTGGGSQSPFSMIGSTPLLPSNVNPVYDSSGGLIAFQNAPPPAPTPATPPTVTPPPKPISPKPPAPKLSTYTVQRGDTLSGIAAKEHLPGGWNSLYQSNLHVVGPNPNLIYAGQKLTLPR